MVKSFISCERLLLHWAATQVSYVHCHPWIWSIPSCAHWAAITGSVNPRGGFPSVLLIWIVANSNSILCVRRLSGPGGGIPTCSGASMFHGSRTPACGNWGTCCSLAGAAMVDELFCYTQMQMSVVLSVGFEIWMCCVSMNRILKSDLLLVPKLDSFWRFPTLRAPSFHHFQFWCSTILKLNLSHFQSQPPCAVWTYGRKNHTLKYFNCPRFWNSIVSHHFLSLWWLVVVMCFDVWSNMCSTEHCLTTNYTPMRAVRWPLYLFQSS